MTDFEEIRHFLFLSTEGKYVGPMNRKVKAGYGEVK